MGSRLFTKRNKIHKHKHTHNAPPQCCPFLQSKWHSQKNTFSTYFPQIINGRWLLHGMQTIYILGRCRMLASKFATKTDLQNFNNSNEWWESIQLEFWSTGLWLFFLSFAIRLKCNSHKMASHACEWCWKDGFYFPFQYETISLFYSCLAVQGVHKSIFGILYAHAKANSIARHTCFDYWREKKRLKRSSYIDSVAIQHCSKCKTVLFA